MMRIIMLLLMTMCTQTAAELMKLNTARIRDVELLTGLEFLRNVEPAQSAVRIRVSVTESIVVQ